MTLARIESYTADIPRFDDWNQAACLGFFGYANGRAAPFGKAVADATRVCQEMPCNSCPEGPRCWDEMKGKAAGLFPAMVEAFEEMAKKVRGPELLKRWSQRMGGNGDAVADPYTYVMLLHMQIGLEHEHAEGVGEGA